MRWWMYCLFTALVAALGLISGNPVDLQQNGHLLKPEQTQTADSDMSTPSPQEINQAVLSVERPIQSRRGFHKGPLFESLSSESRDNHFNLTQPGSLLENLRQGFSHPLHNSTAAEIKEVTDVTPQQRDEQAASVAARILDSDSGNMPHVVNSSRLPLRSIIKAIAEHANVRVASGFLDYDEMPAVATNENHITITKMVDVSNAFIGTTTHPNSEKDSAKIPEEKTDMVPSNKFSSNNSNSTVKKNPNSLNFSENLIDDGYSDFVLEAEYFSPKTRPQNFDFKDTNYPRVTMYRIVIPSIIPCEEECQIRMADTGECKTDYACLFKRLSGQT